jgi:hypothetical protein
MEELSEVVARAMGYPYAVPSDSFLLADGGPRATAGIGAEAHTVGRTPLLAYGSNASPEALARKLGAGADPVLARRATLADFDVVYSAHISRYGSIPAALRQSPGTEVALFVVYLSAEQLQLISLSEPNYEEVTMGDISCELENGETLTEAAAYLTRHGCLLVDGAEVALEPVEAKGRRFPAMSQAQVQEQIRTRLAPGRSLERFVFENATDPELAQLRTAALGGRA